MAEFLALCKELGGEHDDGGAYGLRHASNERDMLGVGGTYGADLARAAPEMLAGTTHFYRPIEFKEREGRSDSDTLVSG